MLCGIFITIFLKAITFCDKLVVTLLETITDIFEEHKSKNHILIFRCSQITTKFIRTVPDAVFDRFLFDNLCFLCHIAIIDYIFMRRYQISTLTA